ncbi:alpha/beta fold hydrolase [Mesobaculum littorinae]|uniref:Alpha/beta fold hydrolase n=1 Tax=Mesobaculum littorinae TaxID=2486419 RepID=A0A438AF10_9RHOB|nr:alpha/beta hydrolase [Mesobaculum littorinae]RVV97290.1 alpha/beta fold hydrolase [Mesobaculum littorinae]
MPHFTTSDDIRLHYTDDGAGTPILCLAGLTRDGRDFDYMAPHLDGVRLIRLDYRGRGGSQHAPADTYTVMQEAQDALALLDHLQLSRSAILGTSRGGLIAMALAMKAKSRLTGVCLNDVGPVIDPKGLQAIAGYLGKPPAWSSRAEAAIALPAVRPAFRDVPATRWEAEAQRLFTETDTGLGLTYDPALREAFDAATATPPAPDADPWAAFEALEDLPLALIRGEGSNILSQETAQEMRRRRPDMIYAEISDRGHVPFLDEPDALVALRAWVARL